MNVTHIEAALVLPQETTSYVQNFTKQPYFINVPPAAEVTIDYFWRADPMIEPMQLGFLAILYYSSTYGQGVYKATVFNGTISIKEAEEDPFTGESFPLIIGILCVGGFLIYTYLKSRSSIISSSSTPTSPSSPETGTSEVNENWLEGTAASQFGKKKGARKTK